MPLPHRSRPFGDLEATVMDLMWSADRPLLVREVIDLMRPERAPAYTTVMTVMDNLHRKGWLDRRRDGMPVDDDAFVALTHTSGARSHLTTSVMVAQPGPPAAEAADPQEA